MVVAIRIVTKCVGVWLTDNEGSMRKLLEIKEMWYFLIGMMAPKLIKQYIKNVHFNLCEFIH